MYVQGKNNKEFRFWVIGLGLMFSGFDILNLSVSCMKESAIFHGIFQSMGKIAFWVFLRGGKHYACTQQQCHGGNNNSSF